MNREEQTNRLLHLMEIGSWGALRDAMTEYHPSELAGILTETPPLQRVLFFRILPRDRAATVFSYLDEESQTQLIHDLRQDEVRRVLNGLPPDDRTHLLEELPGRITQQLLNLLDPEELAETRLLLGYPEESVGRLVTPDYVAVRPQWTVEHALRHLRKRASLSETISRVYVVDDHWKLLDDIDLRRLILADPEQSIRDLMNYSFVSIQAPNDREEAVRMVQQYDLESLPVVDSTGVLIGIVTVDDLLDVSQQEATEDFHKSAGLAPLRMSYRMTSPLQLFSRRIGWLSILILVNLISSNIIRVFETTLQRFIALAFFIPLLIGSGGNTGSQSATIIIRALAVGDIAAGHWIGALLKEIGVGILLGTAMGILSGALGWIVGGTQVGLVVGLAMVSIVLLSNLIGTLLPFLLARLRLDPAVASSPLIATVADAIGLLLYFSIAIIFLRSP